MKSIDKYYSFLELFNDCQEKATIAIRDLGGCNNFRTAKIRNIITNPRFEGVNENFKEIEPFIDKINSMIDEGYDIEKYVNSKDNILSDDYLFKLEELDEIGLKKYSDEMCLLGLNEKHVEYLYYRETALKDKANKEIGKLKAKIEEYALRVKNRNNEIAKLRKVKNVKAPIKKMRLKIGKQLKLF